MKTSMVFVLFISTVLLISGCGTTPVNPRVKPDIAGKITPVSEPDYPIKDQNLSLMYKRIRNFASVPWEQREAELFNIISNKISIETADQYSALLDMDQDQVVAQYLGPIKTTIDDNCRWFKPPTKSIHYVRGGDCVNGVLEGVAEFVEQKDQRNYSWWVLMKGGEAVKGVRGQSEQLRSLPGKKIEDNPFHNWRGISRSSQVASSSTNTMDLSVVGSAPLTFSKIKPLGVGHLNRNFNWHGYAAEQGDGRKYRYVAEYIDGQQDGWAVWYTKKFYQSKKGGPKIRGIRVRYVGQTKNGDWSGVGVWVTRTETFLTPNDHWVPKNIRFSLGWKKAGDGSYQSNGPTIFYSGAYVDSAGNDQAASIYYGYDRNSKREGPGGHERLYGNKATSTMIGMYENGEKAGYHRWYRNGNKMNSDDWCYNTRKHPCKTGGDGFGKLLALAGGALLANSGNLSSVQRAEFMTAYTADVLTDSGGTNTRAWGDNAVKEMQSKNQPADNISAGSASDARLLEATINNYTCPESRMKINNQKVTAYTQSCLDAAVNLIKVMGCNMINEQTAATQRCNSACNNPQCLDMPPGGGATSGGSADSDLDFLNNM